MNKEHLQRFKGIKTEKLKARNKEEKLNSQSIKDHQQMLEIERGVTRE